MSNKRLFFIFSGILANLLMILAATLAPFGYVFAQSDPNANVAAAVQSYFSDIPVMIAIAKCESGPRQFAANGGALYAGTGGDMVGIFQIDSAIHTTPARALGFDITTVAGNMGYARYLYGAEGTSPWISSFPCWSYAAASTVTGAGAATGAPTQTAGATPLLTLNLSLGSIDPQVLILQQLLNKIGYTLAVSGPGSPGNETTKFGALTLSALRKFQCAQGIACSGDEATTGYGFLNASTRTALLAAAASAIGAGGMTAVNTTGVTSSTNASTSAPIIIVTASTTASTSVVLVTTPTDNPAQLADLQSRVAALVLIVQQLEAQLAMRLSS